MAWLKLLSVSIFINVWNTCLPGLCMDESQHRYQPLKNTAAAITTNPALTKHIFISFYGSRLCLFLSQG